jgi:uncharacterized protein
MRSRTAPSNPAPGEIVLFAIVTEDKPNAVAVRLATRGSHLEYLKTFGRRIVAAGPLLAADGETMTGSLLIVDVADRAEAESFAAGDPSAKAGLFARTTVTAWRKVILNPTEP